MNRTIYCFSAVMVFVLASAAVHAQSNINPVDKFAWGENTGFINWFDANGGTDGVRVEATFLSGFAWGENIGWINFGNGTPANGTNYANVDGSDFGVNLAMDGSLNGFAWGENIGWINFDTSAVSPDQARLDAPAGRFRGYAWGENIGWINLDDAVHFVGVDLRPPANDDCANAIVIGNGTLTGTLIAATDGGDASCGSSTSSPDVWYSYTATCNGTLFVNTCGTHDAAGVDTGIDTVLSVYGGCPGTTMNQIECNDDWPSGSDPLACAGSDAGFNRDSAMAVAVMAGDVLLIRVSNFNNGPTGEFTLTVDCFTPPPANDDCTNAQVIGDGTFSGTLEGATTDGDASCGSSTSSPDVWYNYTATCDGTLMVNTCGTHDGPGANMGIDTVLSVHLGCPGDTMNEVECSDDWPAGSDPMACSATDLAMFRDSAIAFPVTTGDALLIRVSNFNNSMAGPFTLTVTCEADQPGFRRGDCNDDGSFNIADSVFLLSTLFPPLGSPPPVAACVDACDSNDDGGVNIADAVTALAELFPGPGGPAPLPAPGSQMCGIDPTADMLDCANSVNCP